MVLALILVVATQSPGPVSSPGVATAVPAAVAVSTPTADAMEFKQ